MMKFSARAGGRVATTAPRCAIGARDRLLSPAFFRGAALAVFLPLVLLLASCSVLFVSPYDEITDRGVNDLVARTETFLVRYAGVTDDTGATVQRGRAYDAAAATFYSEARGAASAMLLRSSEKAKNEEEIEILTSVDNQYRQLEASHRLGRITRKSAAGLHRTLRSLLRVQLIKKGIGTPSQAAATGSETT